MGVPITGGPAAVSKWPSFRGRSGDFVAAAVRRLFPFSKTVFTSPHALPAREWEGRSGFSVGNRTAAVVISVDEQGLVVS